MATSISATKSHSLPHLIGKNYNIALKQSIEALLTSRQNPDYANFANFTSEFEEFVQLKADAPLESIWIYAALTSNSTSTHPPDRISAIKDLFHLIVSCSASCNSLKSIALVAPVVYYLHSFILDLKGFQLGAKRERKVNGEIKSLIDSVLGYINVCCNGFDGNFDDLDGLTLPLGDLISFWLPSKNEPSLSVFFPLISEDILKRVSSEGCGIVDLAGLVIAEAFLLKICWNIRDKSLGHKSLNELKSWIVGSVTGLKCSYFYVILAGMLLEPVLPITSLLNLENEHDLKKILFDALVLVEYSFLSPESLSRLPPKHARHVMLSKLMASYKAIELFREHGEHTKAVSCINAFTSSSMPNLIVKNIRTEFSVEEPTGTSPKAILKWLLGIENRGMKVFDDDMSKYKAALEEAEQLGSCEEWQKPATDLDFYIDNKGGEEDIDDEDKSMSTSMNAAFISAAHSLQLPSKGGKKRRNKDDERRKQIKYVKYNAALPGERSADQKNDNSDSASDIDDPSADESMGI